MNNCSTTNKNRLQEFLPSNWANFDSLLGQVLGPNAKFSTYGSHVTPASAWEDDNSYHVEVDVPGVSREDIELTFEKGTLQINVERKRSEEERKGLHDERFYGKASRAIALPETIDTESIRAELTDGVLHVTVAKVPEVQPKRIEIN